MASPVQRRPLPALLSLVALLLLTGLVWWRVINRSDGSSTHHAAASTCPSASAPVTARLPAPASVTVQVLNSTTKKGIAGKAQSALGQAGFRTPTQAGNDTKFHDKIKNVAQVRYGPTGKSAATLVGYYLPGSTPVATTSKSATVIVSLGLGYKGVASNAAVAAALKRAKVQTGSPSPAASC